MSWRTRAERIRAFELYVKGTSAEQIATELNASVHTIKSWMRIDGWIKKREVMNAKVKGIRETVEGVGTNLKGHRIPQADGKGSGTTGSDRLVRDTNDPTKHDDGIRAEGKRPKPKPHKIQPTRSGKRAGRGMTTSTSRPRHKPPKNRKQERLLPET